jgi:hypothetical protein
MGNVHHDFNFKGSLRAIEEEYEPDKEGDGAKPLE